MKYWLIYGATAYNDQTFFYLSHEAETEDTARRNARAQWLENASYSTVYIEAVFCSNEKITMLPEIQ